MVTTQRRASAAVRTQVRGRCGPNPRAGQKGGGGLLSENVIFPFYFLPQIHSNEFLNLFKVISKVGPKIKVAQKNVLYNFAKKSMAKIQLDFELLI